MGTGERLAEPGQLTLAWAADGALHVKQASPRIWVQDQLLRQIRGGQHHPSLRLDGDVLTIDADNQRVVYRIREYVLSVGCWLLEWPD